MKSSLKNNEVVDIIKKGKRFVSEGITIICSNRKNKTARYAIVISKKRIKKSTQRNRVRRVIREHINKKNIPRTHFVIIYTEKEKKNDEIRKMTDIALQNTLQ